MNRQVLIVLISFVWLSVGFSQKLDTISVKHKRYFSLYDKQKKYPKLVLWKTLRSDLNCLKKNKRKDKFISDPQIEAFTNNVVFYKKSGYDRGHNMPAADCKCDSVAMLESFYFSNITPQKPNLNRKTWNDLEEQSRNLAEQNGEVSVACGCEGEVDKIGVVSVPKLCWKILFSGSKIFAYVFPNTNEVSSYPYSHYEVAPDSVYKLVPFVKHYLKQSRLIKD